MEIPSAYHGREQTFLKHRVLEEYLLGWGHKLGSFARRLCYVDGFAGPWQARDEELADTSISVGLDALEAAVATWATKGFDVQVDAYFVERNDQAYEKLRVFLAARDGKVITHAYPGEFGDHVAALASELATDPAFIFVDPTGWKGAAMSFIAPLVRDRPRRDVLVNVMMNHIQRFKDDPRGFLRQQMRDFFGLEDRDLPAGLSEQELMSVYRTNLKQKCGLRFAADLSIPHPLADRTKFELVVGGNHPVVLELFRQIERNIVGREAAVVRDDASARAERARSGQLSLPVGPPSMDARYASQRAADKAAAERAVTELLKVRSPQRFGAVWPLLMEGHHVTKQELAQIVWELRARGSLTVQGLSDRARTVKDEHVLELARP